MKEIWETLSKIDLSNMIEKKMNLSYLSWANAWSVVMDHYPSATFEILDPFKFDDGSMEVWCAVTIGDNRRLMWLPVMDHRNQSIINPSSRQVSDARMRCLVKCLSMFGLGLYIYQGEDLPRQDEPDLIGNIKMIMQSKTLQQLTDNYKRLTAGHDQQSDYVQKLTKAASNRKGELQNAAA